VTEQCKTDDWVANKNRFIFNGALPACLIAISGFLSPIPIYTGIIWTSALAWMGFACLRNAKKCGRMHCFFSAPFFLIAGGISFLIGLQWIQLISFRDLGIILLIGTPIVCILPEVIWGTYKK